MSVLIKNMEMPKGCIYANDNDQTEYCPLLNHDDVPFCQYIESEPEIAIGIGERPVYCPLSDVPEPCENTVSRQAAIDAMDVLCQEHRYKIPGKIETYSQYNEAWQDALDRAEGAIFNLPSAQPEIIHCKECKYGVQDEDKRWYCRGLGCQVGEADGSGFCADAERRTKDEDTL